MNTMGVIRTERRGHVAVVTIDRPTKLNAFTMEMYRDLGAAFQSISDDESVRCVLLRAVGERAFSVGSDIGEFNRSLGQPERQLENTRVGRSALDLLNACPHPIVVAVEGLCVGGGLQVAAGCDIRVAATGSRFGIPIKNLGMHAEIEELGTMVAAMGPKVCLDLLLTGRMMEAEETLARGFIHRLVEPSKLQETASSLAVEIAEGAPLAARWHKRAIRALAGTTDSAGHLAEQALRCFGQRDFAEGCAAFTEKRKPVFVGT